MTTMEAILIQQFAKSLHELQASRVAIPKRATPTSLLVRITHASLTHVDVLYCQGKHQNNRRHIKPPFILGNEFAGVVVESSSSSSFKPGDRVFGGALGSYAECIAVEERLVRKIPRQWTNEQACAVGSSGAIGWGCLVPVGQLKKEQSVLVTGAAGGLGVMACQIALALGARVIGLVGGSEKARVVKGLGVETIVSYNNKGWEQEVLNHTAGEGVDLVFDVVGIVESSLRCLKYGGSVVIVGYAGRGGVMETLQLNKILLKGASVKGYRFGEHGRRAPSETEEIWAAFMRLVDDGKIKPIVYNGKYTGVDGVRKGLLDMETRSVWGRAVVEIIPEERVSDTDKRAKL